MQEKLQLNPIRCDTLNTLHQQHSFANGDFLCTFAHDICKLGTVTAEETRVQAINTPFKSLWSSNF